MEFPKMTTIDQTSPDWHGGAQSGSVAVPWRHSVSPVWLCSSVRLLPEAERVSATADMRLPPLLSTVTRGRHHWPVSTRRRSPVTTRHHSPVTTRHRSPVTTRHRSPVSTRRGPLDTGACLRLASGDRGRSVRAAGGSRAAEAPANHITTAVPSLRPSACAVSMYVCTFRGVTSYPLHPQNEIGHPQRCLGTHHKMYLILDIMLSDSAKGPSDF